MGHAVGNVSIIGFSSGRDASFVVVEQPRRWLASAWLWSRLRGWSLRRFRSCPASAIRVCSTFVISASISGDATSGCGERCCPANGRSGIPILAAGQSAVADALHQMFLLPVLAIRLAGSEVLEFQPAGCPAISARGGRCRLFLRPPVFSAGLRAGRDRFCRFGPSRVDCELSRTCHGPWPPCRGCCGPSTSW